MYDCLKENGLTGYKYKLRDIAVVEVLFATGAREYEISNIREDSVNLNSGQIRIIWSLGILIDHASEILALNFDKQILFGIEKMGTKNRHRTVAMPKNEVWYL